MDKDELTNWACKNGWQIIAGWPSLTKSSSPGQPIVRMVFKATMVSFEIRKPAGKWEKVSSQSYAKIQPDPDTGMPAGMGLETTPGITMLMQQNKDRQVFGATRG
jgi:hypothetical protein